MKEFFVKPAVQFVWKIAKAFIAALIGVVALTAALWLGYVLGIPM